MIILETDRLALRWLTIEDAEFIFDLLNQPSFLQFIGDKGDRKSTRLNSSHGYISYAVFCLKKKKKKDNDCDTFLSHLTTLLLSLTEYNSSTLVNFRPLSDHLLYALLLYFLTHLLTSPDDV